jgi:arabinose-5-phosphate isomerase
MLQDLFADQRRYLNAFFDEINLSQAELILDRLLAVRGRVLLSGVGKSGLIAAKIAATMISIGTRASFLSPSHALHGDIGCISKEDLWIAFSKSGESVELLQLLPFVRERGVRTIAIVSRADSSLAKASDDAIVLPVMRELCPYDLAPTTSTAVQLIFGDCLAIALMKAKQFNVNDFAANHPAGLLGRKITLKVADLMIKGEDLPLCSPFVSLIEVLHELSVKRCGCLLVVDAEKTLQGIFTDGDLRRAIQVKGAAALQQPMKDLMTAAPKRINPEVLAWDAMKKMEEDPNRLITVLPVTEQGRVLGLLRIHDILQAKLS